MKGKKRATIMKSLALALLATVMLPLGVSAESSTDNLVLNKEVWLEDDGTYTVQLEAYAKGQVSAETIKVVKPADIILVLDQSGSMVLEENNVNGIPTDTYTIARNVTNAELLEGSYYCKVDNTYYKIIATKEIIKNEVLWIGDDGESYEEELITNTYTQNGQQYTAGSYFLESTLKTYTRTWGSDGYYYVNDKDSSDTTTPSWRASTARRNFTNAKDTAATTVEVSNDGTRAIVFTAVNEQRVNTVRYSYKYIDAEGNEKSLGSSATGNEETISAQLYNIDLVYSRGTTTGTRLKALQYAANEFIESIQASAVKNNVHHRVAVVGFASDEYKGNDYHTDQDDRQYYYSNTELFIGATQYNYHVDGKESTYSSTGNLASDKYGSAFQDVLVEEQYNNLLGSLESLAGKGGTHPSLGFEMANGIFEAYKNETEARTKIIIFLTDGEPGDRDSYFDSEEASATIEKAEKAETDYGAKVYTVAVLDQALKSGDDADTFLKDVATGKTPDELGTYTLVTEAEALKNFFETVDKDINNTSTTVTLSEDAIMLDRVSNYFKVPEGFNTTDNVTVQVAKHLGNEVFDTPTTAPETVSKVLSYGLGDVSDEDREIKGAYARGFNFVSEENVVTTTVIDDENSPGDGTVVANGYKLIMTIKGLLAKDDAATGTYIDTNSTDSGVWDTDQVGEYGLVKAFEMPRTLIQQDAFVIDYAKEATLDAFGLSANRLDNNDDLTFSKVETSATSLTDQYGKAAIKAGTTVNEAGITVNELTYKPTKMNWNGFDTFYALGKDANDGDDKTQNLWKKISVIPANNVYYEDDFVTNTTDGTDTVGIVYSGEWKTEGTAGNNKENENTAHKDIHGGWQNEDLADDTAYTDGTAHVSSTQGATATFTFTGTGVDIYSRTNANVGLVKAQLFKGEDTAVANMTQTYVIDNISESGDYYQIPTATFKNLEHGTYTVKLTVAAKKADDNTTRATYYLDGIRVYNPLSAKQETNGVVSGAYGNEVNAMFKEVRDILLDSKSLNAGSTEANGVVFIDKSGDGTVSDNTSEVGTYEEYGPKNEVYLAQDQAIAFHLAGGNVQVGLKAPAGATTAQVTNGDAQTPLEINASSDLFYAITPNKDGLVIIKNTTENLLAVTKLKITGVGTIGQVSVASVLDYADTFDSLPVIDWVLESEENMPEVDDKDDEASGEDNSGNVEIENSEPETDLTREEEILRQLMKQILGLFRNWLVK